MQLNTPSDYNAIKKVAKMLSKAEAKGMSEYVKGRLRKSLVAMKADSAMAVNDLDMTLKFQEELLCLPLNRHEKVGVKLNIGMTYLRMGRDDMALDIFTGLLSEPPSQS